MCVCVNIYIYIYIYTYIYLVLSPSIMANAIITCGNIYYCQRHILKQPHP